MRYEGGGPDLVESNNACRRDWISRAHPITPIRQGFTSRSGAERRALVNRRIVQ